MADNVTPVQALTPRERIMRRKAALWLERSSWITHWQDISKYQQPRLGRFVVTDRNRGDKRTTDIIDNTAMFAARTLAAGMMSGTSSPARPWFRLGLADKDLMESGPVKVWLHECGELLRRVFASSNTYRALHQLYEELGLFGTAVNVIVPSYKHVIHNHPITVGEYALGISETGEVNTLVREFQMSVGQLVERWGMDAVSATVKNLYNAGNVDSWVNVIHMVQPRHERDREYGKADSKNKPFQSCYLEAGSNENKLLSESGFDRFPALCPRWVVTGNDIYGSSPGMECLGDVKQLQHQQLRKGQAIDYQVNPPLAVPVRYKNQQLNRLPGGIMYVDGAGQQQAVRSAFEVNLNLQHLLGDIQDVRERIRTAYYADLFLMLANDTRSGTTATEIAERHEEKLLMLGPVLERLQNELHQPLIEIAFERCAEVGILPEPPRDIQGMKIEVEFISVLAQAQRAVATQGMDRLLGVVSQIAAVKLEVLDKVDFDQAVDDYATGYGVNPALVVPDDQVAAIREQRAQQAQAQQMAMAAPQMVDSAKTASEINTGNLSDVMNQFTGYNTPSAPFVGQ